MRHLPSSLIIAGVLASLTTSVAAPAAETEVFLRRYVPITPYTGYHPSVDRDGGRRYTYMDVADTHIASAKPDANFGGSPQLVIADPAGDRILIAFQQLYRAVTVGSTVQKAELVLVPAGDVDRDAQIEVYRVLAPWRDGSSDGAPLPGATSHRNRFAYPEPHNRPWTQPGGDADVAEAPSLAGRLGDFWDEERGAFVLSGAGLSADVNTWLGRYYRNYGWMVRVKADTPVRGKLAFHASDVLTEAQRPALRLVCLEQKLVKPELPDLTVTFIERTPRYYRYNDNGKTTYERQEFRGDQPGIMKYPDYADDKKWPEPGELVVFIAHIKNASDTPFHGPLTYRWKINDKVVREMKAPAEGAPRRRQGHAQTITLGPWEEVTTRLEWHWDVLLDDPRAVVLEFEVDPEAAVEEITRNNNGLTKYVAGKTFKYWVERGAYEFVKDYPTPWGSYSFEDYLQWHMHVWNETYFDKSRFDDFAPDGGLLRVSLDDFEIVPDGWLAGGIHRPEDVLDPRFDGEWGTEWILADTQEERAVENAYGFLISRRVVLEGSLLHEGSHQVWGAHDVYWSNIEPSEPDKDTGKNKLKDETGLNTGRGDMFAFSGLMGGCDTRPNPQYTTGTGLYEANSVGGMNANVRFRNGFFGEWQYDMPERCLVKLTSPDGKPLAGAKVSIWQSTWGGITNDLSEVARDLTVGPDGVLALPLQDSLDEADYTTITGHTLRKMNPWGRLDVVGQNIVLLLQVNAGGQRDYQFVRVHEFNRAYWAGHQDTFTVPYACRIAPSDKLDLEQNVAVGAKVRTSLSAENTANIVDGDATTRWQGGTAKAGDWIEIELPEPRAVGVIRIVQDGGHGAFFQRFRITTRADAQTGTTDEPFAEQTARAFSYSMSCDKDYNPERFSERWVTYARTPQRAQVIRIEALEGGGTDLAEIRVFAER